MVELPGKMGFPVSSSPSMHPARVRSWSALAQKSAECFLPSLPSLWHLFLEVLTLHSRATKGSMGQKY
jgi:hypothetical protein